MTGIILNITAYCFSSVIMYFVCDKFSKEVSRDATSYKLKLSGALLLMVWCIFMTMYLVLDYDNIIKSPLNVRLNFFETITNMLIPVFMLTTVFSNEIIKTIKNEKSI